MLGVVVSRADEASVHIGEHLLDLADWETPDDDPGEGAGGDAVYRTEGAELREFDDRHLDLERPADAFGDLDLLVFASKHAGDTGRLLTAHHTGNLGPADHGGEPNALARAAPNAHATVVDALDRHAPADYDVGVECTHHGPTDVGAPSLFVEVGSGPEEWAEPAAAAAVARAILDLREVAPDRPVEAGADRRRHLVGLGGGHYAPRFERVIRETEWAVGHVAADWGLEAMPDPENDAGRAVLDATFEQSAADYALVAGERPDLETAVRNLGYRPVSETWVRETSGVPLRVVEAVEADLGTIESGVRFGARASAGHETFERVDLSSDLVETACGIDQARTREALATHAVAFETTDGGSRPTGPVALVDADDREAVIAGLADVLRDRFDEVRREGEALVARETAFVPEKAKTLGVPEGPTCGRLAAGERVEVDGREIPPEAVREEREVRFPCR